MSLDQALEKLKFEYEHLSQKSIPTLINCYALILQKCFRGYYSRKYRNSHFKRKEFIKNLINKTAEIREMQYEYSIKQALVIIIYSYIFVFKLIFL